MMIPFAQTPIPTPIVDPTTTGSLVSNLLNSQTIAALGIPGFFAFVFLLTTLALLWFLIRGNTKPSTMNTKLLVAIFQVQAAQHHQALDVAQGLLDTLNCVSHSLNTDATIARTQQALNQPIVTPDIMQLVLGAQAKGGKKCHFVSFPH
jgi:hypothetical protein